MNRKQRRERIYRLKEQQKKNREAKRPKSKAPTSEDVVGLLGLIRYIAASDAEFLEEYSTIAGKSKRLGIFLLAVFALLNLSLYFNLLPISDEWDVPLFFLSTFVALMPWMEYLAVRDRIPFWKNECQQNSEYVRNLEERLANFK